MAKVGFVGLGVMGGGVTRRLLQAGHEVSGYNRSRDKAAPLVELGLGLKDTPREEWERRTVGEVMGGCSPDNTIAPEADVMDALKLMQRTGGSRVIVADGAGRVVGVVALKDLLNYVSLKTELE